MKEKAVWEYVKLFEGISKNNNIVVIIQPYARQYVVNDKVLNEVLNYEYLISIEEGLKARNIQTINLNPQLKEHIHSDNYLDYSWELDGHYNSKGYGLLSTIIADELNLSSYTSITKDH